MKPISALFLSLCFWTGNAVARTDCRPGAPIARSQFAPQVLVDGLAVSLRPDMLAVWPQDAGPELNVEVGVWMEFKDGTSCQSAVTRELAHGSVIMVSTRNMSAVEVGLCDIQKGLCFPVRVSLSKPDIK